MTTWVVSPHLLVAQAVAAALTSAGAQVEVRAWETVVEDAEASRERNSTRHVVAVFDGLDSLTVLEELGRLVSVGDVRVAVVVPSPAAPWWGELLAGKAVDLVTTATSITQLVEVVERLTAGDHLMDPEKRIALRAAWVRALDNRRELIAQMRTLTPQQLRVLELLAAGRRSGEVADLLGVTVATVRSHVKALRAKLGAKTQLEAVAMLRRVYEVEDGLDVVPHPRQPLAGTEGSTGRR